jgi:hypothetical protein
MTSRIRQPTTERRDLWRLVHHPARCRAENKPPLIDHIAYTIEAWDKDAVEAELERRGLSPRPDTENSFHVKDPDGYDLQISGKEMKP